MVDLTVYPTGVEPTLGLKQVFGRLGTSSELCLKSVNIGLRSFESYAMLGDDLASAKATLRTISTAMPLGNTDPEIELALLALASVWQTCHTYQTQMAQRRANLELDPNKVPEMSSDDHASLRSRFLANHEDIILVEQNEPHKRFVEKVSRDFLVQAIVKFYEIAEIRTKDEQITMKTGFTDTAEDLLKISKKEEEVPAASLEIFWNRLNALFVALEYLNICSFTKTAGPLRYVKELRVFERERSGLAAMLLVDKVIRKKVQEVQEEERETFKTFSAALIEVLDNHKYLWNDARTRISNRSPGTPQGSKRKLQDEKEDKDEPPTPQKVAKAARRKKQKMKRNELLKAAKAQLKAGAAAPPGSTGGGGSGQHSFPPPAPHAQARPTAGAKKKIPDDEFKKINAASYTGDRRCNFYNSSLGCKVTNCKWKHTCVICGAAHPMVGNH